MTREQQKKLREIKKELPVIISQEIKKYKFKKKDYMVWHRKGELFFDLFIFVRELDGHCYIDCTERFKPLWLDDLFWDVLQIQGNKNEPLSLRSIGAFTVWGCALCKNTTEVCSWSVEEVEKIVQKAVEQFDVHLNAVQPDDFDKMLGNGCHGDLRTLLWLIHEQRFAEAIDYADAMDHGYFENQGLEMREAAKLYCQNCIK